MVQSTLKQQLHDAELEVKEQAEKHQEILQYSQSLTENNASSKASVAELQAKVQSFKKCPKYKLIIITKSYSYPSNLRMQIECESKKT